MSDVETILFGEIETVAAALVLPVKWPNRNGPVGADVWIEVVHLPNGVAKEGWEDLKATQGIMNVGVHVPPDTGSTDATAACDAIAAAFPQGRVIFGASSKVEIYTPVTYGALVEDGQKAFYPLQVRYRSFAS